VPVNGLATRGALLVLALLAGVWLAFGIQNVRLTDDADAVLAQARKGPVSAKQVDAAVDDYRKARRLSPDETPLINEGQLLLAAGRQQRAREVALYAAADEPDNLQAWLLAYAAFGNDPHGRASAKAQILKLNPWFLYVLTRRSPTP
jgi:predicted Zn-dependent protease